MFDNQVFAINGDNMDKLKPALSLAFTMLNIKSVKSFRLIEGKGLVFSWGKSGLALPTPIGLDATRSLIIDFLKGSDYNAYLDEEERADISFNDSSERVGWEIVNRSPFLTYDDYFLVRPIACIYSK